MNQVVMMNNFIGAIRSLFSFTVTKIRSSGKGSVCGFGPPPAPNPFPLYLHSLYPALKITMEIKSYTGVFFGKEVLQGISPNSCLLGTIK